MDWTPSSRRSGLKQRPLRRVGKAQRAHHERCVEARWWARRKGAFAHPTKRFFQFALYTFSTPHHSAMNSAVALVDLRSESRSTHSLKPCTPAPLAPKQRLGKL